MNEYLDKASYCWDVFYNDWFSFMPEQYKPALLVLVVMTGVVLHCKRRLARANKDQVQLNYRIDELRRDIYNKVNDKAGNSNQLGEIRALFKDLMVASASTNTAAMTATKESAQRSNDSMASTCKDMAAKFDATVNKALEKIANTQENGNSVLNETISQFVDMAKSNHRASMKAISWAIDHMDEDEDEDEDKDKD